MKRPAPAPSARDKPRLGLAAFTRRILLRGVFLLLVVATLALALVLLQDEKERSYANYQRGFLRTQAELMARLRHPAGLLALLNPGASGEGAGALHPLLLPYSAIDFDDQHKAQQAVEMAGCSVRYPDGSSVCVAIGSDPYAGGFVYLVGRLRVGELVPRERGMLDLGAVHRAHVSLSMRGETWRWVAPFEQLGSPRSPLVRGRLTGFVDSGAPTLPSAARPVRDFRGWLWQAGACAEGDPQPGCLRDAFFSIRLPVEAFSEALFGDRRPVWPPPDLDRIDVRMQVLGPGSDRPLFDTAAPGASPPPSLQDLRKALLPGETLSIRKLGAKNPQPLVLQGRDESPEPSSPLITRLVRQLPVKGMTGRSEAREVLATPAGRYEVLLTGDARGIERGLSAVATRMSWYVAAMLGAIVLAWLVIELGLIRRITVLTRRAAAVSRDVQQDAHGGERIGRLDVSDLRGRDELGILAGGLADLLQRVKDDVQREQLRARQERDMLQAVGHEILSPLQSLMVLHAGEDDPARRYVQRMQHAVQVLYGQASPSEALAAADLALAPLDLDEFLRHVAGNAAFAGIAGVEYRPLGRAVTVRADEFSLEDVLTHLLRNADRHRTPGTPIGLRLSAADGQALVRVHNRGPAIDPALLDKVFDYGVSDAAREDTGGRRGQGLFVARTYLAKMGGRIRAANEDGGVALEITLPLAG
ncbi:HAMP domain-containing sensor histidine kinase [Ramlibacter tataouinensis]|uniref:sensor histidine kinase n=1 Tax=Ramlibacter tataouinensis TaxID=94132 RepID=UPI0022F3865D|nr:HAMP domain-containing sensor histidine kinase [Ramlibacter tataouinensis]WBY00375.1 HAMP domain-containing sensor histidine kinase [Ramlibacter tataouinensis]